MSDLQATLAVDPLLGTLDKFEKFKGELVRISHWQDGSEDGVSGRSVKDVYEAKAMLPAQNQFIAAAIVQHLLDFLELE